MSYTSNHTNSSGSNFSNHGANCTPLPIKSDTDDDVMSLISKLAETHSDSDSDDDDMNISWRDCTDTLYKYVDKIPRSTTEIDLIKLKTVISDIRQKMICVKKHVELINQRDSLLFQSSKISKKRRRTKGTEKSELTPKRLVPN